jgi:hypothetical protein
LAARAAGEAARREQRERAARAVLRGPPAGVRLALAAINDCLREDGFERLRFLHAGALDGRTVCDVEAIERDEDALGTALYLASELQLELDRAAGALTLRLRDGHRLADGVRHELPPEGLELRFQPVDGRHWEQRLGYLLTARGQYPAPPAAASAPAGELDAEQRAVWLSRLAGLLEVAAGELRYRVHDLRGLADGAFTEVLLLGYDAGGRLVLSASAERMAVRATPAGGELVLESGTLRKAGGETTIPAAGYRILLPDVTREAALDAMLGMVVQ